MIIYLRIKYESNAIIFSKDIKWKPFLKLRKGHNSHNNWWILPLIELDLYFMIIYMYIKYESNTLIFSKRYRMETIFQSLKRAIAPIIIFGFYP